MSYELILERLLTRNIQVGGPEGDNMRQLLDVIAQEFEYIESQHYKLMRMHWERLGELRDVVKERGEYEALAVVDEWREELYDGLYGPNGWTRPGKTIEPF